MKKTSYFKLWGSYVGLIVGGYISESSISALCPLANCSYNPLNYLNGSPLIRLVILSFLGFIIGGWLNKKFRGKK